MPYRDFPLVHSPLTSLIQAAILRLTGRVFFHHVLYAALVSGLATVLAWRIVLCTFQGRLRAAWHISLLLTAPLIPLGVYSILPFPSYDCDSAFPSCSSYFFCNGCRRIHCIELAPALFSPPARRFRCPVLQAEHCLPFLAAAFVLILLLMLLQQLRRAAASPSTPALGALLAVPVATVRCRRPAPALHRRRGNYLIGPSNSPPSADCPAFR